MLSKSWTAVLLCTAVLGLSGSAHGDGIVQRASKDAVKGAVEGAKKELQSPEVPKSAKQLTKSVAEGVADAVPLVTSQAVNQANVNRKTMGKVAREVSGDAAAGMVGAITRKVNEAVVNGDGKVGDAMAETTEKVTAAAVRGMTSQLQFDPGDPKLRDAMAATTERIAAAAVRGATSEMHFNFRVWPLVLAFILGGLSTVLCSGGVLLLYLLAVRLRAARSETVVAKEPLTIRARPIPSVT
ncbi:MAG: hypothetical protein U1A78_36225 [Polyangia bacterium]